MDCFNVNPLSYPPKNVRGFRKPADGQGEQLTILTIEMMADCRGSLLPDPKHDSVRCAKWVGCESVRCADWTLGWMQICWIGLKFENVISCLSKLLGALL